LNSDTERHKVVLWRNRSAVRLAAKYLKKGLERAFIAHFTMVFLS
jgi:hypothetical protein